MKPFIKQLKRYMLRWRIGTFRVAYKAARNRDMVGAASYDYLMQSGYVIMGYFWAQMADAAYTALKAGKGDADFYKTKIQTAEFYYDRMMPRARAHNKMMLKDPASLMQIAEEHFSL